MGAQTYQKKFSTHPGYGVIIDYWCYLCTSERLVQLAVIVRFIHFCDVDHQLFTSHCYTRL